MADKVAAWLKEGSSDPGADLVGGMLLGPGALQHGDGAGRDVSSRTLQRVEIWASDLSLEMLKVAAGAIYTSRDVQGISPQRLRRFFLLGRGPREGSFRIVPEIRDMVKFRHLDLRNPTWPCRPTSR